MFTKILKTLVLGSLALGLTTALSQAQPTFSATQSGAAGRNQISVSPQYYTPEDFGAYGDKVRVSENFIIDNGSNKLELAATYALYNVVSATAGSNQLTLTFPSGSPPINFSYFYPNTPGNYLAFVTGAGNSGGTLIVSITAVSCPAGSNTCIITLASNAATTINNTTITFYSYFSGASPALNSVSYQNVTAANTTFPISDGIPQQVINSAQASGNITSVNLLNVGIVTLGNNTFNVNAGNAGIDIGSIIEVNGAGPGGGLYVGTIIAEASATTAYVYPPFQTQVTATPNYVIFAPYLFSPQDAIAPAKYISIPLAGAKPAINFVGFAPLTAQIASYVDPFNVTLTTTASQAVPSSTITPNTKMPGGRMIIGHNDEIPVTQAFQAAARANTQGQRYVYMKNNYFMATFPGSNNDGTALNSALPFGEGSMEFPITGSTSGLLYYFHGVAPLTQDKPPTAPEITINPISNLFQCNTNPQQCVITFVGNSQNVQFSNGPSQSDQWSVKICALAQRQFAPKPVICNYMAIGGSAISDLDPNGPSAGIPSQSTLTLWYTSGATWLSQVENGTSGSSTASPQIMSGCPDVIVSQFTNVDAWNFSYGSLIDVIALTQNNSWAQTCGTTPDWLFLTDGMQPLGDPNVGNTMQLVSDYPSEIIRGFVRACPIQLRTGGCPGMLADVNRMSHILVDGYDPEKIPMRQSDAIPHQGYNNYYLPFTFPDYVRDISLYSNIVFAPSTGTCTILAATTFANNLSNSNCAWGLLNNELDISIGNPNGAHTSGGGVSGAPVDYPNNQLRLFYNQTNNATTGSLAGMLDYEIDTWNFSISGVSGTNGTNTLTCSPACVNYKHLGSLVVGTNIPSPAYIATVNNAGTSFTLTTTPAGSSPANLTGTVTSATETVEQIQIPRTSSGVYGFSCSGQTSTSLNLISIGIVAEMRGTNLVVNLCKQSGPNVVNTPVVRIGGIFQPTISSPVGTLNNVYMQFYDYGGCCSTYTQEDMPWIPQYAPSFAGKDFYGWCNPTAPTGIAQLYAPYEGQCANHRGALGSKIEDIAMNELSLSAGYNTIPYQKQFAANKNQKLFSIPANAALNLIKIQNTTGNSVTINIGTTAGGNDVAASIVVGANASVTINGSSLLKTQLSTSLSTIYISSSNWNNALLNTQVNYAP